jgi:hypothetical protein
MFKSTKSFLLLTVVVTSVFSAQAETIHQSSQDIQLLTARWTGLLTGIENPGPQTGSARPVNLAECSYTPLAQPAGYRNYDCTLAYEKMKKRPGVAGTNYLIDSLGWVAMPPSASAAGWVQADSKYQGSYEFEVVVRKGALEVASGIGFLEQKVTTTYNGSQTRETLLTRSFPIPPIANPLLPEKTVTLIDGTPGLVYRFLMVGPKYSYGGNTSVGVEVKPFIQYVDKDGTIYNNYDSFPSSTTSYRIDLNYPLDRSQNILK